MNPIRREGAESPEISLKPHRRDMMLASVRAAMSSMFNYYGYDTLDARGLRERGIAYPQPQIQVAPQPQTQPQPELRPAAVPVQEKPRQVQEIAAPVVALLASSPQMSAARENVEAAFAPQPVQPMVQPQPEASQQRDFELAA